MDVFKLSIPSTISLNTLKAIQIPSSLVDPSLVSYAMIIIIHGLKSCLSFNGCLSMKLVIVGLIFKIFGYILNTYGSYLNSIHHSDFYTYQFSPVAYSFASIALYTHGVTKAFVFVVPHANGYDI